METRIETACGLPRKVLTVRRHGLRVCSPPPGRMGPAAWEPAWPRAWGPVSPAPECVSPWDHLLQGRTHTHRWAHTKLLGLGESVLEVTLKTTYLYISWSQWVVHFSDLPVLGEGILASCSCRNLEKSRRLRLRPWEPRGLGLGFSFEYLSGWPNHVKTAHIIALRPVLLYLLALKEVEISPDTFEKKEPSL